MWVGLIGFRLCKGNDLQRREQAVLLDRRSGIFSGKDNFIGMLSRQDGKHRPGGIVGRMGYQTSRLQQATRHILGKIAVQIAVYVSYEIESGI